VTLAFVLMERNLIVLRLMCAVERRKTVGMEDYCRQQRLVLRAFISHRATSFCTNARSNGSRIAGTSHVHRLHLARRDRCI
jgi:hypothetical protein